jgi:hypothetical protein
MPQPDLNQTFKQLKKLLSKYAKGLAKYDEYPGSQAKEKKPGFHLLGRQEVSAAGRKPQQTPVVGIIQQKGYVGFYYSPIYTHPQKFKLKPTIKPLLKGKSCFQIKEATPEVLAELEQLVVDGIALYKNEGWI